MKGSMQLAVALAVASAGGSSLAQDSPNDKAAVVKPQRGTSSTDRAALRPRSRTWVPHPNCDTPLTSAREMKGPGETMPLRYSSAFPYLLTATSVRMPADYKVTVRVCIGNLDEVAWINGPVSVNLDAEPFERVGVPITIRGWRVEVPTPITQGGSQCATSTRRSKVAPETVVIADVQVPDGRPVLNVCRAPVTRLESPLQDKPVVKRPS